MVSTWLATGEVPGSNLGKGENLLISEKKEIYSLSFQLIVLVLSTLLLLGLDS